jgi:hypothetical protein
VIFLVTPRIYHAQGFFYATVSMEMRATTGEKSLGSVSRVNTPGFFRHRWGSASEHGPKAGPAIDLLRVL